MWIGKRVQNRVKEMMRLNFLEIVNLVLMKEQLEKKTEQKIQVEPLASLFLSGSFPTTLTPGENGIGLLML